MVETEDPAIAIARTNAQTAVAQATLDAAKYRLSMAQKRLSTTQQLYLKSSQMMVEQQNKLAQVQAEIQKLSTTTADLVSFISFSSLYTQSTPFPPTSFRNEQWNCF
jgi:septal ring factor EnvC (AmiA/AmiB activator)